MYCICLWFFSYKIKVKELQVKIERMNKGSWGKLRAFFDLRTSDGFIIKGFKIVEGINGLFVGMPSTQNKEGEYYDSVLADKDLRDDLEKIAMRAYGQESVESSEESGENLTDQNIENIETTPSTEIKNEEFNDDDIPF